MSINDKNQPIFPDHPYDKSPWYITNSGRKSWMTELYRKILKCLKGSHSMKTFKAHLAKKGIKVEYSKYKGKVFKNHFIYTFINSANKRRFFVGGKKLNLDKDDILLALQNGFQIRKYTDN